MKKTKITAFLLLFIICAFTQTYPEMITVEGGTFFTQNVNDTKTTIDISKLSAGVYLVEVQSELGRSVNRVVKN